MCFSYLTFQCHNLPLLGQTTLLTGTFQPNGPEQDLTTGSPEPTAQLNESDVGLFTQLNETNQELTTQIIPSSSSFSSPIQYLNMAWNAGFGFLASQPVCVFPINDTLLPGQVSLEIEFDDPTLVVLVQVMRYSVIGLDTGEKKENYFKPNYIQPSIQNRNKRTF